MFNPNLIAAIKTGNTETVDMYFARESMGLSTDNLEMINNEEIIDDVDTEEIQATIDTTTTPKTMNVFTTALVNAVKNSNNTEVLQLLEAAEVMKNTLDNSKQIELEYIQHHKTKEAAKMEPLSYQQLQVLVKSNRPSAKACRANAKADVLVEYLKTINILPQEYVHTSKTTMKKQSAAKSPSATRKPAKNPNGTTKKPIGSVAQKGTAGYPKYRDGQVAAPATPAKQNKKFNEPSDEQIVKAAKSLELQQVAVQAKQSNVHEYNAMQARRAAFKSQIRENAWY